MFASKTINYKSKFIALISAVFLFTTISSTLLVPMRASAAVQNPAAAAKISFTFDDSLASTYTQAAPTLAKSGLTGTDYAITGCVGMTTVPNTCRANTDTPYMSWTQLEALQNTSGWEIGSHTVDHDCLASNAKADPDDCQTATLTQAQVDTEMTGSLSALASHGITATDFAPPYGDFSNMVLAQIAKYYASMRQFKNAANNPNVWPNSDYYLQDYTVLETTDTVASIEAKINAAITNKQWLILTFHDIEVTPSKTPDDYQYGTAELAQIAAYVKTKQTAGLIQSVHVNQGLVTSTTNLLPNPSFNDGIADGWTTDNASVFTADSGTNGSYPDPTKSIKFVTSATGANAHLFSPKVAVSTGNTYMLKNFLNLQADTSGTVGYYVDEYDANGNWVSGQYLKQETNPFVEDMNFTYKPTSAAVAQASLQIIVSGKGMTGYLDNAQWFPLTSVTAPAPTNLVANGTFDAGIADGWTTDSPSTIKADANNNGSPANPVNSVLLNSSTSNTHLFAPLVNVSSANSYSLSAYLNIKQINTNAGSEIGFYVDEYNAAGTWISGQYKVGTHTAGVNNLSFQYKPSSTSVAKASLQIIVVGNSGITAYVDNVNWFQN